MGGLAIREVISVCIHVGAMYTNSYQYFINTPLIGQEKLYYCIIRLYKYICQLFQRVIRKIREEIEIYNIN